MPLTGALQADFSDFVNESKKATAALDQMDAEAKKTGATLAKTGSVMDGFTGKKTVSSLGDLSQGLRTVDSSLSALGYNVGKPIAAIEELGRVSSTSIASLGALGQAGLVLSAAMAGWELGKWIGDISGMDAAAKVLQEDLLGWNNRAQEAAIGQEVLAKASKTAGRTITDMTEAIKINHDAVKNNAVEVGTAIHRQAEWEKEIRKHRAELPEMMAALANHTATVKQLHEEYHISTDALTFYIAKTKDQTAAQKEAAAAGKAQLEAQKELTELRKGYGVQLMSINAETLKAVQADLQLGAGQATVAKAYGLTAQQIEAASAQLATNIKITTGLGAEWANVGEKVKITADSVVADSKRMQDAARAYQAETDRMAEGAQEIKPPIQAAREETERLSVAMSNATHQTSSLFEKLQAGKALFESYQAAGVATGMQIGLDPYNFRNQQKTLLPTMSSTGNTLNVNVNSTEAGDISKKLVDEMRRNGVRF